MSGEAEHDPTATRLVLDMKALGLLHGTDAELRSTVAGTVLASHDEQVKRVLQSMIAGKPRKENTLLIALGELILASFLMFAGIVVIAPFLVGAGSSDALVRYFSSSLSQVTTAPAVLPFLPELVVVIALLLLMSALYALRRASATLKEEAHLRG